MLAADTDHVAAWTRGGRDAYVYFNHDGRAAVRNVGWLIELLRAPAHRRAA